MDCHKIPHKEDSIDFITQGTTPKEKMTSCKIQKIREKKTIFQMVSLMEKKYYLIKKT